MWMKDILSYFHTFILSYFHTFILSILDEDARYLPGKVDWLGGQPPLLVRANIVMIGLRSDIDYGINRAVHFFSEY